MARHSVTGTNDATLQSHHRSSATNSLQSNLDRNAGLSLGRTGSKHTSWRDSMGGIARSVLLKARDSIDTLRGVPLEQVKSPELEQPDTIIQTHGSVRIRSKHGHLEPIEDTRSLPKASSSLRRALTSSSRGGKRSPLLVNLMTKRSSTRLRGPEDLIDDLNDNSSESSPARASLRSIQRHDSPDSRASSRRSILPQQVTEQAIQGPENTSKEQIRRASSPIPIPRAGPPPVLELDIEPGRMSPNELFGCSKEICDDSIVIPTPVPVIRTFDIHARDDIVVANRRSKRELMKDSIEKLKDEHIPRRASTDHWRMRKVSRNRPSRLPDVSQTPQNTSDLPSPMPGTNLPLEDPLMACGASGVSPPGNKTPCGNRFPVVDGTSEVSPFNLPASGLLGVPTRHTDILSGHWISNNAPPKLLPESPSRGNASHQIVADAEFDAIQQNVRSLLARQVLLESSPQSVSPEVLRVELEAGRKALERLENRIAGIEAEMSKHHQTPTDSHDLQQASYQIGASSSQTITPTAPARRIVSKEASDRARSQSRPDSPSSVTTPLEVQDLFYPSDEDDDKSVVRSVPISQMTDNLSIGSTAEAHLRLLQDLSTNGALLDTMPISEAQPDTIDVQLESSTDSPSAKSEMCEAWAQETTHFTKQHRSTSSDSACLFTMGPRDEFYGPRQDRARRYWEIFSSSDTQAHPECEIGSDRTGEIYAQPSTSRSPFLTRHWDEDLDGVGDEDMDESCRYLPDRFGAVIAQLPEIFGLLPPGASSDKADEVRQEPTLVLGDEKRHNEFGSDSSPRQRSAHSNTPSPYRFACKSTSSIEQSPLPTTRGPMIVTTSPDMRFHERSILGMTSSNSPSPARTGKAGLHSPRYARTPSKTSIFMDPEDDLEDQENRAPSGSLYN